MTNNIGATIGMNAVIHNQEVMNNSYNYMVQSFADFGSSVKKASLYNNTYIQNGDSSAIKSDVIGAALKSIWEENADPEFDNFIRNFDVWGNAMVQENALSEDYKAQAEDLYKNMNFFGILGNIVKDKVRETNDMIMKTLGFNFDDGHGYVTADEIQKYMMNNNIRDDDVNNYNIAKTFKERFGSVGADSYWKQFDTYSDSVKVIITRKNSQKAEEMYRQFQNDRKSTAFFQAVEHLDPGEKLAFEQYSNFMDKLKEKSKGERTK